jgi:DNA-directed RNA polymerase specialized sigma24 family protein
VPGGLRMRPQADCDQVFEQPYPSFLRLLGTADQSSAIAEFGRCAQHWLKQNPTKCMRTSSPERRDDVIGDVVLRLIENDAARLRNYKDQGRPFFAWLLTVAENRCKTLRAKDKGEESLDETDPEDGPVHQPASPEPDYDTETLIEIVWKYAKQLDTDCLLGLIGRYVDGWEPRDVVFLLGRSGPKENVRVAARISYCLEVLKELILDAGFRREDFLD